MPSTTALAPEFLTQNRSPAIPFIYASPLVAPYKATFPVMIFKFDLNVDYFQSTILLFNTKIIKEDTRQNLINLLYIYIYYK